MPLVDCDGRKVGYEAGGPDDGSAPLLVLQPPGASGASIWRPVSEPLRDRFRTVAVNPSAYGDTEPFAGREPMTIRDEAAATAAVIRAELRNAAGERAHLVGHSYGGTISLVLALEWPDLVDRLTLLEPAPYPLLREAGETVFADEIERRNGDFIATVRGAASTMRRWRAISTISTPGRAIGEAWTGKRGRGCSRCPTVWRSGWRPSGAWK